MLYINICKITDGCLCQTADGQEGIVYVHEYECSSGMNGTLPEAMLILCIFIGSHSGVIIIL